MTTNDATRTALVNTVNTELMRAAGEYGQNPYFFGESSDRIMKHIDRLLADRAVPEPDDDAVIFTCTNPECDACEAERDPFPDMTAETVERAAKAMWDALETGRSYEFFMGGSADKPRLSAFTWEDLPRMARAALQAAAVEPEPGLDVDGLAMAVQASLNEYTRSRIVEQDGESYIKGYEPAGELEAIRKAIADAVRQVKGTEEGSA